MCYDKNTPKTARRQLHTQTSAHTVGYGFVFITAVVACTRIVLGIGLFVYYRTFRNCVACSEMDTIVSQRGKDNWIYEGYRYRRDRCNADGSSSWRCVRHDCVGRRKKSSDGSSVEVTADIHAPDNAKNDAECVKADIRQRAVNTVERP